MTYPATAYRDAMASNNPPAQSGRMRRASERKQIATTTAKLEVELAAAKQRRLDCDKRETLRWAGVVSGLEFALETLKNSGQQTSKERSVSARTRKGER